MGKKLNVESLQVGGFVYSRYCPEASWEPEGWHEHKILKVTAKFVFIAWLGRIRDTRKLDRAELDRHGLVWHRPSCDHYYSDAGKTLFEQQHAPAVPACLQALGLCNSATAEDVSLAYRRLAKKAHPDLGGSGAAFQELRTNYERALSLVGE